MTTLDVFLALCLNWRIHHDRAELSRLCRELYHRPDLDPRAAANLFAILKSRDPAMTVYLALLKL